MLCILGELSYQSMMDYSSVHLVQQWLCASSRVLEGRLSPPALNALWPDRPDHKNDACHSTKFPPSLGVLATVRWLIARWHRGWRFRPRQPSEAKDT